MTHANRSQAEKAWIATGVAMIKNIARRMEFEDRELVEECSFCDAQAEHFLEGKDVTKTVYYCDLHCKLMPEDIHDGENQDYECGDYDPWVHHEDEKVTQ